MELVEKFFKFLIDYKEAFLLIGGFFGGIIATFLKLRPILKENENKKLEIDIKIFNESNSFLSESDFNNLINDLETDHSYKNSYDNNLQKFLTFFENTSSIYENQVLNDVLSDLKKDLKKLQYFYSTHFFIFPENQHLNDTKFCMYPEGNVDRNWDGNKISKDNYEIKAKELKLLCQENRTSFQKYRLKIKNILKV